MPADRPPVKGFGNVWELYLFQKYKLMSKLRCDKCDVMSHRSASSFTAIYADIVTDAT
jgi:hypothetical protein